MTRFLYLWIRRDILAWLAFGLAAAISMLPLLDAPGTEIMGWLGDNVQYIYVIGHFADSLTAGSSPFFDPQLNFPDGLWLTATDIPYLSILVITPITWVTNPIFSYNFYLFATHFLSGYFAYLWILRRTNSRFGGVIGGLAFMLAPYRIAHSYGHLNLISTQYLVLFFWALDETVRDDTPTGKRLILLGGATLLVGGATQYYLVIALLTGAVYALLMRPQPHYLLHEGGKLILAVMVGAAASALPYLLTLSNTTYRVYSMAEIRAWSPDLLDFFAPPRLHPLWGSFIEQVYPRPLWIEHTLYLGVVTGSLALVGVLAPNPLLSRRQRIAWVGTATVGFLLALGTDLRVAGHSLLAESLPLLPTYYLAQVPYVGFMRVWARAAIIPILFAALLAGVGVAVIQQNRRPWRLPVMALCLLLLCIDLVPGRLVSTPIHSRPVDLWLSSQPEPFAVAYLPAKEANYQNLYSALVHNKPLPSYIHPNHLPVAYRRFAENTEGFPDSRSLTTMQEMGIRYVLVDRRAFDGERYPLWATVEQAMNSAPTLRVRTEIDNFVVYEFSDK